MERYQIAYAMESGAFDVVETFDAENDVEAEQYAEQNYPDTEWYVLRDGHNINA